VYGYRAYPLNKHIPRLEKLQPRAHIEYLTEYDLLNIYRVWIPSQEKVIRTHNITFNKELFYNPAELNLGYILRKEVLQTVKILEQLSITTLQTSTLVDDDVNKLLGPTLSTTNPTPALITISNPDDSVASSTLLDQLLTPEHTPEPSTQTTQATQTTQLTNSLQDLSTDFDS
jgi:hypothetical protein